MPQLKTRRHSSLPKIALLSVLLVQWRLCSLRLVWNRGPVSCAPPVLLMCCLARLVWSVKMRAGESYFCSVGSSLQFHWTQHVHRGFVLDSLRVQYFSLILSSISPGMSTSISSHTRPGNRNWLQSDPGEKLHSLFKHTACLVSLSRHNKCRLLFGIVSELEILTVV